MERTPNGAAILEPTDDAGESTVYEQPQGGVEQAIAQVWREAFQLDRIGRNDNFFELGGDSRLGMKLLETLAANFAVQLPVVALFQNPTIREMAELVTPVSPVSPR